MHLILWLVFGVSPAYAQKPCDLAKFKIPLAIAGNDVTYDQNRFTLEEHATADSSRRGLSVLPRGSTWKHLTLTAKDGTEGPYDFYFQVSQGALTAVDVFTESSDSIKRMRFTNKNSACVIDTYTYSERGDFVLYSRLACESLKKITETKVEDKDEQNNLETAKQRIFSRENISIPEAGGRLRRVNPTSMSDQIKYNEVCKGYSETQESAPLVPIKGRPAPVRQPTPDPGAPSST